MEGFGEGRVGGGGVVGGGSLGFVPRASGPMGVAAERERERHTHRPAGCSLDPGWGIIGIGIRNTGHRAFLPFLLSVISRIIRLPERRSLQ